MKIAENAPAPRWKGGRKMRDLVRRLYFARRFGTETSERNLMVEAADRIAELEAAVATIQAQRNHLIGVLQIAVEQSGDTEHPPAWVDAACGILNAGFVKTAALEKRKS